MEVRSCQILEMEIRTQLQLLVIFGKSQLQEMYSQLQLHKSQLLEAQLHKNLTARAAAVAAQELLKISGLVKFGNVGRIWKKWKILEIGRDWKNWKNLGFRLSQSKFDKRKKGRF